MGDGSISPQSGVNKDMSGAQRGTGVQQKIHKTVGPPGTTGVDSSKHVGKRLVTDGGEDITITGGEDSDDTISTMMENSTGVNTASEEEAETALTEVLQATAKPGGKSLHENIRETTQSESLVKDCDGVSASVDSAIQFSSNLLDAPEASKNNSLLDGQEINADALESLRVGSTVKEPVTQLNAQYSSTQGVAFIEKISQLDGAQLESVSDELSGGDAEVLANLEVLGAGRTLSELGSGADGQFAGCNTAYEHESTERIKQKAESSKGVLIGFQHTTFVSDHKEELVEGLSKRGVDANEVLEKAHNVTGTDTVVFAETKEQAEDVLTDAQGAIPSNNTHSNSPTADIPDSDELLSEDELEAFIGTCIHDLELTDGTGTPDRDQLESALAHVTGIPSHRDSNRRLDGGSHTGNYSSSLSVVQQNVNVAVEGNDGTIRLGFNPAAGGNVEPTYNDSLGEIPIAKEDVRVVAVTQDGIVDCRKASEFEVTPENKLAIDRQNSNESNDPVEGTHLLAPDNGDNYKHVDVENCDTSKVTSAEQVNEYPSSEDEIPSLKQVVGATAGVQGETFLVGGEDIKHGRDGESFFIDNLFSVKPDTFEAEKNEFPDVPRALVEIKTYKHGKLQSSGVHTGKYSPIEDIEVTDGVTGDKGVAPKETRYVVFEYGNTESISNRSQDEIQEFIDTQPSVNHSDVIDDETAETVISTKGERAIDKSTVSENVDGVSTDSISSEDVRNVVSDASNSVSWRNALDESIAKEQIANSNSVSDVVDDDIKTAEVVDATVATGKAVANAESAGVTSGGARILKRESDLKSAEKSKAVSDTNSSQHNAGGATEESSTEETDGEQRGLDEFG